jgi:hypothetical protein
MPGQAVASFVGQLLVPALTHEPLLEFVPDDQPLCKRSTVPLPA